MNMTYILMALQGFRPGAGIAYPVGAVFTSALLGGYVFSLCMALRNHTDSEQEVSCSPSH